MIVASFALVVGYLPFGLYLNVLPWAVSNPKMINWTENYLAKNMGLDLQIKNPKLKTSLSSDIEFFVDDLSLKKENIDIFKLDNFETIISVKEIFQKNIIIKKLGVDNIFADVNKLMTLGGKQETEPKKSDWNLDFYDSILYVKNSMFLYKVEPATYVSLSAKDVSIDNTQKELRYVHFNLTSDIKKSSEKIHFNIADRNAVYIKDKAIWVDKCYLVINKSKIFFNVFADKKKKFNIEVFSDKIDMADVLTLINSGIVENNLDEPLAFFKDLKGSFNFNIKLTDKDLNGVVNLNKFSCKIVPIANIPLSLEKGKILMTKDMITLKDFQGVYNNRQENKVEMSGTVKDYLKSIDTNVVARAVVTNDFAKNYMSKIVGVPIELTGGSTRTRVDLKAINNKIDVKWLFGLKSGQDILIDGASLTPADYRRMLKAILHFEDNILNIKNKKIFHKI